MELIAHTPPKMQPDIGLHPYAGHICDMLSYGMPLFEYMLSFSSLPEGPKKILQETLKIALMLHDMGKLDELNQKVLRDGSKGGLPVDHLDAGIAVANQMGNELAALLIRGHHAPGLANYKQEKIKCKRLARNFEDIGLPVEKWFLRGVRFNREDVTEQNLYKYKEIIQHTEKNLQNYICRQKECCGNYPKCKVSLPEQGLITRLMISVLVDADHSSAAAYSANQKMKSFQPASTRWDERLVKLDAYVEQLDPVPYSEKNGRNKLRHDFYQLCRFGKLFDEPVVSCSGSVGLGKTTSVTAYLLRKAIQNNASRLFFIAPYTNILSQTIKTFRDSLVLDDENPIETVIEHHHRVEFSDIAMRRYAISWAAPIIVTTAVQFFETLSSCNPTQLKKLHSLAGSVIFIDESHACLPSHLLAISWQWLKELADNWGCKIIFSSGSMVKFWQNEYLVAESAITNLPEIVLPELSSKLNHMEKQRVTYKQIADNLVSKKDLIKKIIEELYKCNESNPCSLLILNTVQSCAYIAYYLAKEINQKPDCPMHERTVLHLSTGLNPIDREKVIQEVKNRQKNLKWKDRPWYLVATSCVEAGVNLDFQFAYRERCSLTSFLQVSGRVNRNGKRENAILYDFQLIPDGEIILHPDFEQSSIIFANLWEKIVSTDVNELVTMSQVQLFNQMGEEQDKKYTLLEQEQKHNFQEVSKLYKIIAAQTYTVITDKNIVDALHTGAFIDSREIQNHSVQLWFNKIRKFNLKPIRNAEQDEIYSWIDTYTYDDFLGIYAGVIHSETFFADTGGVI